MKIVDIVVPAKSFIDQAGIRLGPAGPDGMVFGLGDLDGLFQPLFIQSKGLLTLDDESTEERRLAASHQIGP